MAALFGLFLAGPLYADCRDIHVFDAEAMISQGDTLLIDVREPYEFKDCRIPGSINVPGGLTGNLGLLERKKNIIIYCRTGHRSAKACKALEDKGLRNIHNLSGGITAWYNTGKGLEGSCEGRPNFMYDKSGKIVRPDFSKPLPEPEIRGCK